jgi:hypothetical protein
MDSADFVDFKTTTSVLANDIKYANDERAYHMQGALIQTIVKHLYDMEASFTLIYQEKKPPYSVRADTMPQEELDIGTMENRRSLGTFAHCLESNNWPGPGGDRAEAEEIGLTERALEYRKSRLEAGY